MKKHIVSKTYNTTIYEKHMISKTDNTSIYETFSKSCRE